jgi:hypothetical protein
LAERLAWLAQRLSHAQWRPSLATTGRTSRPGQRTAAVRSGKAAAIFQPTESQLHRTVAELLEWTLFYPTVWTTFPAGWGHLPKATAGRLRGAGLKAGFPDILIFYDSRCVGLELKVKGRKPSAAQQLMFARLRQCGMRIFVCENVDEVIDALQQAKIPLRGRCGWAQFKEDDYETSDADAEARRATQSAQG